MRIAIVTDAWAPQINGVVRTLQAVKAELERQGHELMVIAPDRFASVPCPTYPEIRLALASSGAIGKLLADFRADAIHLATEGPLCLAARRWCLARRFPFTTAYHTQFPDYVAARTGVSPEWVWRYIRWFHAPA
ncbi:MAG TPA: glycosyltransferase, partial [Sphingomonas sp.]